MKFPFFFISTLSICLDTLTFSASTSQGRAFCSLIRFIKYFQTSSLTVSKGGIWRDDCFYPISITFYSQWINLKTSSRLALRLHISNVIIQQYMNNRKGSILSKKSNLYKNGIQRQLWLLLYKMKAVSNKTLLMMMIHHDIVEHAPTWMLP